jgi:hypothetical protein
MKTTTSKKPFEDYLDFIENDLGYQFFDYQKALLRKVYECEHFYYCTNRFDDTHWLYDTFRRLNEKEN